MPIRLNCEFVCCVLYDDNVMFDDGIDRINHIVMFDDDWLPRYPIKLRCYEVVHCVQVLCNDTMMLDDGTVLLSYYSHCDV